MFTKSYNIGGRAEWIARPELFATRTAEIPQSMGKDENGKKIVKSGTVFPSNDGKAEGIVVNDIDVTNGPTPGAILTHGYVIESRLPEQVAAEAKTALKLISFEK